MNREHWIVMGIEEGLINSLITLVICWIADYLFGFHHESLLWTVLFVIAMCVISMISQYRTAQAGKRAVAEYLASKGDSNDA